MSSQRFAMFALAAIFFMGSSASLITTAARTAPAASAQSFTIAQVDERHRIEERRRLERQRLERQRADRQRIAVRDHQRQLDARRRADLERQRHDRGHNGDRHDRDHDRH